MDGAARCCRDDLHPVPDQAGRRAGPARTSLDPTLARSFEAAPRTRYPLHAKAFLDSAHSNGIESFWASLKRGYHGVYHQMSPKHLPRYVAEFSGRHNDRPADTEDQITHLVKGMDGKRLRYSDLIAKPDAA